MMWLLAAGAIGAVLRLALERRFRPAPTTSPSPWAGWPIGILLANLIGTAALGTVLGYARAQGLSLQPADFSGARWPEDWVWLIATGLCGSLTTVSTLCVGVDALFRQQRARGWCYLVSSLALGLVAGLLGVVLGRALS